MINGLKLRVSEEAEVLVEINGRKAKFTLFVLDCSFLSMVGFPPWLDELWRNFSDSSVPVNSLTEKQNEALIADISVKYSDVFVKNFSKLIFQLL